MIASSLLGGVLALAGQLFPPRSPSAAKALLEEGRLFAGRRSAVLGVLGLSSLRSLPASAYDCKWSPDECARREAGSVYLSSELGSAAEASRVKLRAAADVIVGLQPLLASGKLVAAESTLLGPRLSDFTTLLGRLASADAGAKTDCDAAKKSFLGLASALKQRNAAASQASLERLVQNLQRLS
mmetsp:Transcript_6115/g.10133  ORF Transcript_6115/g.10133 Transcript_6115/m.10133 type:complete len:184 (-) Transcript_6115:154-705(-)